MALRGLNFIQFPCMTFTVTAWQVQRSESFPIKPNMMSMNSPSLMRPRSVESSHDPYHVTSMMLNDLHANSPHLNIVYVAPGLLPSPLLPSQTPHPFTLRTITWWIFDSLWAACGRLFAVMMRFYWEGFSPGTSGGMSVYEWMCELNVCDWCWCYVDKMEFFRFRDLSFDNCH